MIKSLTKKPIDDKFISKDAVDPALNDIIIERYAKYPEIEESEDNALTPKQLREKYEKHFHFETETLVTKVFDLLEELSELTDAHYIGKGINNCLFLKENKEVVHDEFNRFEMKQVYEIIEWCYQI